MAILVDTGSLAAVLDDRAVGFRLSAAQSSALSGSDRVFVSAISFYEIGQKVRIGKWPEMTVYADDLDRVVRAANISVHILNGTVLSEAALMDWDHRDPFGRIVVATARHGDMTLLTTDRDMIAFYGKTIS